MTDFSRFGVMHALLRNDRAVSPRKGFGSLAMTKRNFRKFVMTTVRYYQFRKKIKLS